MNAFFFWLFSAGMIVCALAVILNRNAVASALCFTFAIVFMSGLFVMLSAFFLAAVQIIVTAGAVMVLFLFIIMLLDLTEMEHHPRQKIWMACTMALAIGFLLIVARTLAGNPQGLKTIDSLPRDPYQQVEMSVVYSKDSSDRSSDRRARMIHDGRPFYQVVATYASVDDTHKIGHLLFTTYVAPFEITSLLILVATIGVIVLCKQDEPAKPRTREQIAREAPPIDSKKETALRS
jgi:NADH-quinone oxidoreductase subunit J